MSKEETAETEEEVEEKPVKAKPRKPKRKESRERNTIYIGKKPLMSYALAALLTFNAGNDEVVIKARGRSISTAVDVAEVIKRRLYANMVKVKDIAIDTEILGEDQRNVSTMEIVLVKK
ncbi:MAG: DNA-binding protein Alba [Candidatus Geothermarchaeales archaeon]